MPRPTGDADFADYFRGRVVPMRRLAYALCGDWHTAEDLVQTAFVALYRNWGGIRPESLDAYARRVLVNTFLSHRRNRRRESVTASLPEAPVIGADPGARIDLGRALAELPPRQRAAVVLRHIEDLPVSEVADILGMAEGTVKSQTARGVEALRHALNPVMEQS